MFGVPRITLPSKVDVLLEDSRLDPSPVIWAIEDLSNLLQAVPFGLREQEPSGREDDDQQHAKHDIVVPSDVLERDRVDKSEDDKRAVDRNHLDGEALCSQAIREDLSRVSADSQYGHASKSQDVG